MTRELERTKQRYLSAQLNAQRQAALNLTELVTCDFYIGGWTGRAVAAYSEFWEPAMRERLEYGGGWKWDEIITARQRDFKACPITIWVRNSPPTADDLCGIALLKVTDSAVKLEAIEGYPLKDCPMEGYRAVVAIETAACYAQALGKSEIRLVPANDSLAAYYANEFSFELVKERNGEAYYRRRVP